MAAPTRASFRYPTMVGPGPAGEARTTTSSHRPGEQHNREHQKGQSLHSLQTQRAPSSAKISRSLAGHRPGLRPESGWLA